MRIETLELNDGTLGFRFTVKNSKNKVLFAGIVRNHVTKNKWLQVKSLKTFNKISIGYYTMYVQKPYAKLESYQTDLLRQDISLTSSKGARW